MLAQIYHSTGGVAGTLRGTGTLLQPLAEFAVTAVWMLIAWRAMRGHERASSTPGKADRPPTPPRDPGTSGA